MNIVRCPRCQDDVTVPMRASPKALVRCPLCLEEYLLTEALGGLPPALIVLDGSEMDDEPALVGAGVAQAGVGGGDEYLLSGGGYDAAFDSAAPARSAVSPARPVVTGPARPQRKEKNALVEMLKIVVGGLVGLSIGYLVLLWMLDRDVLDLGPKVAPYAPWLVPAKFHGKAPQDSTASTATSKERDTSGDGSSGPNDSNGKGKKGKAGENVGDVAPSSATDEGSMPGGRDDGGLGGLTLDPELKPIPLPEPDLGPLLPEINPRPAEKTEPSSEPDTRPKAVPREKPESAPAEKPVPTPLEKPEPPPPDSSGPKPKSEPKPEPTSTDEKPAAVPLTATADDFSRAAQAAAEGYTKVNQSTGQPAEVRRQLYSDMYAAASEVGRIVSQLDASNSELAEPVGALKATLDGLAAQPGKVSALKSLTDINLPQRKHDEGVMLAGVAEGFESAGSLFACKFRAGKSMTETIIVAGANPADFCKVGDELLLVGRVVENPAKNLRGYEGEHERVVLLGYAVTVPKAEPAPKP